MPAACLLVTTDNSINWNLMPGNCEKHLPRRGILIEAKGIYFPRNLFPRWNISDAALQYWDSKYNPSYDFPPPWSCFPRLSPSPSRLIFIVFSLPFNCDDHPRLRYRRHELSVPPRSVLIPRQSSTDSQAASIRLKVFQLNNRRITQALNDYGVLNEVIES